MKTPNLFLISLLLLVITGCSEEKNIPKSSYTFTAKLVSVVSHKGYFIDGERITHTIQVTDFNPTDIEFEKYLEQFVKNSEYKHIRLTKITKIQDQNGIHLQASELEIDNLITFTVHFSSDAYNLFTTDLTLHNFNHNI